jgi:hypothetical protein
MWHILGQATFNEDTPLLSLAIGNQSFEWARVGKMKLLIYDLKAFI